MTHISFEFEELLSYYNIEGLYCGTIIDIKNEVTNFDGVKSKCVTFTWELSGVTLNKRFKFWDLKPSVVQMAVNEFKEMSEAVGVKVSYDLENKRYDVNSNEFLGKQADLQIKRFLPKNKTSTVPLIEKYYKAGFHTAYISQTADEIRSGRNLSPIDLPPVPPPSVYSGINDEMPF